MTTIDGVRSSFAAIAASGSVSGTDGTAWNDALIGAMAQDSEKDGTTSRYGAIGGSRAAPSTALAAQEGETTESAADQFIAFVHMDPVAQMRAQILGSMGLTEEQLAAMPEDERKRIENKIRQIIEETVRREAAEKSAAAEQPVQQETTDASGETAATAGQTGDGNEKTAQNGESPSQLEILLPFLRPDGGPRLGGTQADATATKLTPDAERRKDETEAV